MFSLLAVNVTLAICCGRSAANPSAAVAAVDRRERQTLDRFVASARVWHRPSSLTKLILTSDEAIIIINMTNPVPTDQVTRPHIRSRAETRRLIESRRQNVVFRRA